MWQSSSTISYRLGKHLETAREGRAPSYVFAFENVIRTLAPEICVHVPPRSAQNRCPTFSTPVPGHPVYDLTQTNALPKLCCPYSTVGARPSITHPPRPIRVHACRFHRAPDRCAALCGAPTPARNLENTEPQNAAAVRVLSVTFPAKLFPARSRFLPLHKSFWGIVSARLCHVMQWRWAKTKSQQKKRKRRWRMCAVTKRRAMLE